MVAVSLHFGSGTTSSDIGHLPFSQWKNGDSVVVRVQRDSIPTHVLGVSGSSLKSDLSFDNLVT